MRTPAAFRNPLLQTRHAPRASLSPVPRLTRAPDRPPPRSPAQAWAIARYGAGGIRGCEIGSVMFGLRPYGTEAPAAMELVRLAIPRRTYTQSHIDYVIEVVTEVATRAASLRGYKIVSEPAQLRHFTARFPPH